ncbi:hypothetical protein [Streptomyces sp. NPDC004728]|uniref:hypothetical protein n=1 Tax=Streptomyces sp. NPDC004728 TaxID=3154289 RepID=UPI0033AA024D
MPKKSRCPWGRPDLDVGAETQLERRDQRAVCRYRRGICVLGGVVAGARPGEQRTDLVGAVVVPYN